MTDEHAIDVARLMGFRVETDSPDSRPLAGLPVPVPVKTGLKCGGKEPSGGAGGGGDEGGN